MNRLFVQILGQSWKSTRATSASHPRYYGALAKEVDFTNVSRNVSLLMFL